MDGGEPEGTQADTQRLVRLMMLIDDKVDDIWHALYKKRDPPYPERTIRHRPEE